MDSLNFLEPYVKAIFGFMGVAQTTVISAPGRDDESIALAVSKAKQQMSNLFVKSA
jgi:FMN-dependent NADH-azoreductase